MPHYHSSRISVAKTRLKVRSRVAACLGLMICFSLGEAQILLRNEWWTPIDKFMANASCNLKVVTLRTNADYDFAGENRPKTPDVPKELVGNFVSLAGYRMMVLQMIYKNPDGSEAWSNVLYAWNGLSGASRSWWNTGGKDFWAVEKRKLIDDPTIDPSAWTYRLFGMSQKLLIKSGVAKAYQDGHLLVLEGKYYQQNFKAWVNPRHSDLIERVEFSPDAQGVFRRFSVPKTQLHKGVWLPSVLHEETYLAGKGAPTLLRKKTISFINWQFGQFKKSDLRPLEIS